MKSRIMKNGVKWGSLLLALFSAHAYAQNNGTIMIEKDGVGTEDVEFTYSGSFEFTLSGGLAHVQDHLAAGSYTITEDRKDGWHVDNISCDFENDADSTAVIYRAGGLVPTVGSAAAGFDPGDDTIAITLAEDETVECHYTNAQEGAIKIIKRVKHNGYERLPTSGEFEFVADLGNDGELELPTFKLSDGTIKLFKDAPIGENTFYELAVILPDLVSGLDEENAAWDVTDIECRCVKTDANADCASTWSVDLDDSTLDVTPNNANDDDRTTKASVTVDLKGGELVICEFFNEDIPCPPGTNDGTGDGTAGANNNNAASAGTNAGLATTDVGSSAGGCSSTGTGVAGLGTILMLLASLVGVRAMRRVRVRN